MIAKTKALCKMNWIFASSKFFVAICPAYCIFRLTAFLKTERNFRPELLLCLPYRGLKFQECVHPLIVTIWFSYAMEMSRRISVVAISSERRPTKTLRHLAHGGDKRERNFMKQLKDVSKMRVQSRVFCAPVCLQLIFNVAHMSLNELLVPETW